MAEFEYNSGPNGIFAKITTGTLAVKSRSRDLISDITRDLQETAVQLTPKREGRAAASIYMDVSQGRQAQGRFTSDWIGVVGYDRTIAPHGPPIETGTGIYGPNKRPYLSHTPDGSPFWHPGMRAIAPIGRAIELTKLDRDLRWKAFVGGTKIVG